MPDIQHVFVLMLENRSFDHLLGNSGLTGTDAETQMPTKLNGLSGSESNPYNGKSYAISKAADGPANVDPGHEFPDVVEQLAGAGVTFPQGGPYPPVNGSGYAASFMRTAGEKSSGRSGRDHEVFRPIATSCSGGTGRRICGLRLLVFVDARPHFAQSLLLTRRIFRRVGS